MKRKAFALVIAALLIVAAGIGGTLAYFTATQSITNTFTVGNVRIRLYESDNNAPTTLSFISVPGKSYEKNPAVEVLEKSEDCYLFFEASLPAKGTTLQYELNLAGWTHYKVPGAEARRVYVRKVLKTDEERTFALLQGNSVTIPATATSLTEEKLVFRAYAVQSGSVNDVNEAWRILTAK